MEILLANQISTYGGTYFFGLWSVNHFDIFIVVSCLHLHDFIAFVIGTWQVIDGRGHEIWSANQQEILFFFFFRNLMNKIKFKVIEFD
jgi:hypothetical protein